MSNKLVMRIAVLLCLLAGFAIGMNIFGLKDRSYSVKNDDCFYKQPSVTAQAAGVFAKGEELDVTDKLELAAPTAVKVLQTKIVEDKNRTKYQLREGDVYKLAEARMDKANTPCVIEVQTTKGAIAKLEVDKALLQPVDEGTWLQVRSKDGAGAWVRVQSRWY